MGCSVQNRRIMQRVVRCMFLIHVASTTHPLDRQQGAYKIQLCMYGEMGINLKALSNSNRWCNEVTDPTNPCHCNDDNEDPTHTLYPWVTDPNTPLTFPEEWHSNGQFYYSTLDTLSSENWEQQIQQPSVTHPPADIVIVSAGNGDIALDSVTPAVFQTSFNAFLSAVVHKAYPHQKIVVRTPQYMGYGNISFTSWGGERSRVFANIIRDAVHMYNDRVVLWDVHQLAPLHTCWTQGTPYSKRGVIALENLLLFQLLCPIK
ncbi:hypothetical protein BDF14DRAFT_543159 [Spinellus fusiger]|nr:hypothetical protein BDF14DRAFT_543159 [Spinellus fusiger]